MRASAGSLMHNFKKRFRSSASPCASGVSVALRTRRLMQATDSGVYDDRRCAISMARSRALPLTVSCTSPFLSASRGSDGIAHEDVHERGWRSDGAWQPLRAAGAGKEPKVRLRQSDQVVTLLRDTQIARER